MLARTQSAVLLRVRSNLKAKRVGQLADGSWLVDVNVRDPRTRKTLGTLRLREIHTTISFQGGTKPTAVRFWTTLLNAAARPRRKDPAGPSIPGPRRASPIRCHRIRVP